MVSGSKVPSNALWYVIKSNNGITIINKAGEKAATIYPVREGATVKTAAADTPAGKYIWQTRLYSTGGGRTGVNILDESGAYSWFAQPANYKTVVLKPADKAVRSGRLKRPTSRWASTRFALPLPRLRVKHTTCSVAPSAKTPTAL